MNFKTKNKEELNLDITPLIDVVFLLLIFFMVSTTFKHESEINIVLPTASNESVEIKENIIDIGLDMDGKIYINGVEIKVSDIVEEYLTLYAKYLNTEYTKNVIFNKNFLKQLKNHYQLLLLIKRTRPL